MFECYKECEVVFWEWIHPANILTASVAGTSVCPVIVLTVVVVDAKLLYTTASTLKGLEKNHLGVAVEAAVVSQL